MRRSIGGAVLAVLLLGASVAAARAGDLRVTVDGVANDAGRIMVALHAPGAGVKFPAEAGMVAAQWREAAPGTMAFVFAGLADGRYAVAVFHDENADAALDTNVVGMPTEGYGFSRNARGNFGPPSFEDAAIAIAGGDADTQVTLAY